MSTDGKFSDPVDDFINPTQAIFGSVSCAITKQAAVFRSKVENMICLEWGFERDNLIARLNELERIKKRLIYCRECRYYHETPANERLCTNGKYARTTHPWSFCSEGIRRETEEHVDK